MLCQGWWNSVRRSMQYGGHPYVTPKKAEFIRCYFMKNGRIENVEMLRDGPDTELIEQAKQLFQERYSDQEYDGFEVWSGKRFVYREPQ